MEGQSKIALAFVLKGSESNLDCFFMMESMGTIAL